MIKKILLLHVYFFFIYIPFQSSFADVDGCEKVWSVENIKIDEISDDVNISRTKGFEKAASKAINILFKRIITTPYGEDDKDIPILSKDEIEKLIDFKFIKSETVLSNRFLAEISFCFLSRETISFLNLKNLSWSELTSSPILIFPVWKTSFSTFLWKDPNPWRNAFKQSLNEHSGLSLQILPEGRIGVQRSIDSNLAIKENKKAISGAIKRGQARRAVISIAEILNKDTDVYDIKINANLYNFNGEFQGTIYEQTISIKKENLDIILKKYSKIVINSMEKRWKQANIFTNEIEKVIYINIKSKSFKSWSKGIEILQNLPGVKKVSSKSLTYDGGLLEVIFLGDENKLISIMLEKNIPISGTRKKIIINSEKL